MSLVRAFMLLSVAWFVVAARAPAATAGVTFTDAETKTIARYEKKVKSRGGVARLAEGEWAVEMPEGTSPRLLAEVAVYLERVDAFVVRRLGAKKRLRSQPTLVVFRTQEEFLERVDIVGRTAFFRAWADGSPVGIAATGKLGKKAPNAPRGENHVYTGFPEDAQPTLEALDLPAIRREVARAVLYSVASGNLVEAFWFDRGASQVIGRLDPYGEDDAEAVPRPLFGEPRPALAETFAIRPETWIADNDVMLVHDAIAESVFCFLETEPGARWRKKMRKELARLRSGRGELLEERDVARLEAAWHAWLEERESG